MKKAIRLLCLLTIIFSLVACSETEEITPNQRFEEYMDLWKKYDFSTMYDMLATESKNEYEPEQFIDRYQKIYEDLDITDVDLSFEPLTDEMLEQAKESGEATFTFSATMESVAGPIEFTYDATFVQEIIDSETEETDWFLRWDPGFIFPPLKDGGEIRLQSTEPVRGEILDRNRMPLAINDYVYEVGIVPGQLGDNPDQAKQTIANLLKISVDTIEKELSANWVQPDLYVPIKKLPKTEENTINQLQAIDGVMMREVLGRVYPLGEAAAHLVGYIGQITAEELEQAEPGEYGPNDIIGKRGLEQIFEDRLKGERGIKILVIHENGQEELLAEKPVKDGENIMLTIDVNIQEKLYDAYDDQSGTAAAIDPKTGETLALVSSPSFDPNEFLYGITQSRLDELENDPKQPIINRFTATFAPGSVIKPISAAIGLKNGTIDPDEGIEIKGLTWDNGEGWGDYQVRRVSQTDRPVDLADAMIRSDNIYFAMKAVEMGSEAMTEGLENFGFGEPMPFAYPMSASSISNSGKLEGEVQTANTSYGQAEVEMSALHLAIAYTTFLNEGNMLKPLLLTSEETGQVWKEDLISPEDAELMQDILRDVVVKGTARIAHHEDLAISGKTGTAELKLSHDTEGHENGWFVGYPTEKQDILIAMMVEHVEDIGTSSYVAEKVTDILLELNE